MPFAAPRRLASATAVAGLVALCTGTSPWRSQAGAAPPPPTATLDVDGDGELGALSDGILILRFLFGFTDSTLTSGAVDLLNCTRCEAGPITVYLGPSGLSGPSAGQPETIAIGTEFQVATYTVGYQHLPAVGIDAAGGFVVTWDTASAYGGTGEIFARRFDSTGVPLGELQVAAGAPYQRQGLAVAADGRFVVAWRSADGVGDGDGEGVFARLYASDGSPVNGAFQVNAYTTSSQSLPAVMMDPGGGFTVAWRSSGQDGDLGGVFLRRFDSVGAPQATELQVNSYTSGDQTSPALGPSPAGFLVVWQSAGQDGDGAGIFARRFDSAGAPQAMELQVNAYTTDSQYRPGLALGDGGQFLVVWESRDQDGDGPGIFARRVGAGGLPLAAELQVNAYTTEFQYHSSVARDINGNFVVVWQSRGQDGSGSGIFGRRVAANSTFDSDESQINLYTAGEQRRPRVAQNGAGDLVVVWHDNGRDGDSYGVFGLRLRTLAVLDVDGNGELGALTDGLLILRFLFGFTGPTLTSGAVAGNCTRCTAPAILTYLQGLDPT